MKKNLQLCLLLLLPYATYAACELGDADFTFTVNSDCSVLFSPCNSAGFGTWEFGDGNMISGVQGTVHCYSSGGSYIVKHYFNGQSVTKTISFTCNQIDFTFSVSGCCVTFNASGHCKVGSWTFGDGSGAQNVKQTSHCYTSAGTYMVNYIVGNTVRTKTVTITECNNTPCPSTLVDARYCRLGDITWQWSGSWPNYSLYTNTFTYQNVSTGNYISSTWRLCWEEYDCNDNLIGQGCDIIHNQPTVTIVNTYCPVLLYIQTHWPFRWAWIRLNKKKVYTLVELTVWDVNGCSDTTNVEYCNWSLTGGGEEGPTFIPDMSGSVLKVRDDNQTERISHSFTAPDGHEAVIVPNLTSRGSEVFVHIKQTCPVTSFIEVVDLNGRKHKFMEIEPYSPSAAISTIGLDKGIYFVRITNTCGLNTVRRLVVH